MIGKFRTMYKVSGLSLSRGAIEIALMIGLLVLAIAVPVTTKMLEKSNFDTRNLAAGCQEACPNSGQPSLLQSCHPVDADGSSNDSLCNTAGRVETCGGDTTYYCCPSAGGTWTRNMTAACTANLPAQPTAVPTTPGNPTAVPTVPATCQENCNGGNLLQSCHPADADGSTNDSLCNTAGRIETCGPNTTQYCCPAAGGNWTTDMTACATATVAPTAIPTVACIPDGNNCSNNALTDAGKCTNCCSHNSYDFGPTDVRKCGTAPAATATPTTAANQCSSKTTVGACDATGGVCAWYYCSGKCFPTGTDNSTACITGNCTQCGNPAFKARGDANCNGTVDGADKDLWTNEFVAGGYKVQKNNYQADFNCDGFVDVDDRSIFTQSSSANGGNQ